ncbi:YrhK family protein [Streptomyces albus]|uniref:YrhK family protein n=1 Tax=Streptomyces albus TaxID=1888 RepID=UPI003D15A15E
MPKKPAPRHPTGRSLTLHIGHEELVVRRRYEAASVVNDALIAAWFLVGSVMFLSPDWTRTGTWFFILGSIELMIRPVIRLSRQLHLTRIRGGVQGTTVSDQDY